jgi:hypothetical protein
MVKNGEGWFHSASGSISIVAVRKQSSSPREPRDLWGWILIHLYLLEIKWRG